MVAPVPVDSAAPRQARNMVDHVMLHRELAKLPGATAGGVDLHQALHDLTLTTVAALGIDGAGVTVSTPTGNTQFITATDSVTLEVERCQDELHEGACVDSIRTSQVVAVTDLSVESRWPRYRPVVLAAGFHAVAGVPIPFDGRNIGAVNLYLNAARPWTTEELAAARTISNLAAGYLINRVLLRDTQTLAAQLQEALDSRIVIEQAKGMIAARHGITTDAAFDVLRSYARSQRAKLRDVADSLVSGAVVLPGGQSEQTTDH
jgi:GAF domain-containing protein